jgi:hypothetical protein
MPAYFSSSGMTPRSFLKATTPGRRGGKVPPMNKVLLPKMTAKALGGLNALRRPLRPVAAGFKPGRPSLPDTYLPRFA